jgi:hypothetical protein
VSIAESNDHDELDWVGVNEVVILRARRARGARAPAAADDRPHGGLVSAGLGLGIVRVDDPDALSPESGGTAGLIVAAGYGGRAGVGGIVEAAVWRAAPSECAADGPCYNDRAERTATTTLGLRWQLGRALYVQGSGGAALTWTDDANGPRRHWWSPVGVAAVGWRWTIPDAVLGFELRASALRNDTTTVSTVAAVLAIGHAW